MTAGLALLLGFALLGGLVGAGATVFGIVLLAIRRPERGHT